MQQVERACSLSKTLKDVASGKISNWSMILEKQRCPKGQRICKIFGAEWRETSCTPCKRGRFGPLVQAGHSDSSDSIHASRKAIFGPKNYAGNLTFISWHFLDKRCHFVFESADSVKLERLFDPICTSYGAWKAAKRSNPKIRVPNSQESSIQQLHTSVQCSFWCQTSLHLQSCQFSHPTIFVGKNFVKYIPLEYDETQIINV